MQRTPSDFIAPTRDTNAWRLQVWVSFGLAVSICALALLWLPGESLDRAFMVMGYVFCLSAAFALSKFVRDNDGANTTSGDTPLWKLVVWGGFAFAMGLTAWGLLRMEISDTYKWVLAVSWLFLISSAFTLAKTLRDQHEFELAVKARNKRAANASERSDKVLPPPAPQQ